MASGPTVDGMSPWVSRAGYRGVERAGWHGMARETDARRANSVLLLGHSVGLGENFCISFRRRIKIKCRRTLSEQVRRNGLLVMFPSNRNARGATRDEVLNLDQLPPLAFAAVRLVELASDLDVEVEELASVIEQDPPLTARILGMANSGYFGQVTPVLRVKHAIVRVLGLNRVRSLSLVMALAGSLDTRKCPAFDPGHFWLHALLTATAAAAIGQRVGGDGECSVDSLYLCGLLSNIGLLVMVHVSPAEMSALLGRVGEDDRLDPIRTEREVFGVDHRQAGEWLALRWDLPAVVCDTLACIADPRYPTGDPTVTAIVRAAGQWAEDCLNDRETSLQVPGTAPEVTADVAEELLPRLDRLRALAGAFTAR